MIIYTNSGRHALNIFMGSLKDVERRTATVNTDEDPSGWRPYLTFVETIREKYTKNEGFQGTFTFADFCCDALGI